MAHSLSILRLVSNTIEIDLQNITSVLKKVGNRPFVLYSINGNSRTGKSLMLNFFLQYLQVSKDKVDSWIDPKSLVSKFKWCGGIQRVTEGINMWSEPFVKEVDGREICLVLMDTQGSFDSMTSTHENAVIFAFSTLLSSVMIWNQSKDVGDDVLQFLQCFLGFAKMASEDPETDTIPQGNKQESFQKLVFLLRDFSYIREYPYGYFDDNTTQEKNFKINRLNPSSSRQDENNFMRQQILQSFSNVGLYALPRPGEGLIEEDKLDDLNPKFVTYVKEFVELMFSQQNLITKHVGGIEVTGTDFIKFVQQWIRYFQNSDLPKIGNLLDTNIEIQNTIAVKNATEYYDDGMHAFLQQYPDGVPNDSLMESKNAELVNGSFKVFRSCRRLGGEDSELEYSEILKLELMAKFPFFIELNLITRKNAQERSLIDQKQKALKVQISNNEEKLKVIEKQNEEEQKRYSEAIAEATRKADQIRTELVNKIAAEEARRREVEKEAQRLKEIQDRLEAERQQRLREIEEAKRQQEELQRQIEEQQRQAEAERQRLWAIHQQQNQRRRRRCIVM